MNLELMYQEAFAPDNVIAILHDISGINSLGRIKKKKKKYVGDQSLSQLH